MDEALIEALDANHDGNITLEEWHQAVHNGILKGNYQVPAM